MINWDFTIGITRHDSYSNTHYHEVHWVVPIVDIILSIVTKMTDLNPNMKSKFLEMFVFDVFFLKADTAMKIFSILLFFSFSLGISDHFGDDRNCGVGHISSLTTTIIYN
jgi:hypothetical protein